jgi:hypothetical protein
MAIETPKNNWLVKGIAIRSPCENGRILGSKITDLRGEVKLLGTRIIQSGVPQAGEGEGDWKGTRPKYT